MNATLEDTNRRTTSRKRLLSLAAILTLTLAGLGATQASAKQAVPLTASVAGAVAGPTNTGAFSLTGSGKSSHLGNVKSYTASGQISFNDGTTVHDTLIETYTAANGDQLVLQCEQVATFVSPGVLEGTDAWTIISGTGRFSAASGSGTGHTHADLNTHTFTKDATGSIDY